MPVTARLSRKLYDKLGDEVANELVDWFNAVDLSYRAEFREMFATHFTRIDAALAQTRAELRSEFRAEMANLEKSLIRWMFVFWMGAFATIIGTIITLAKLGVLIP